MDTHPIRLRALRLTTEKDRTNERMVYPAPANETKVLPSEPHNGHGPYRFPTQPDGVVRRNVHVTHESSTQSSTLNRNTRDTRDSAPSPPAKSPVVANSRNVAGPAVYYPPGHTPFQKKEGGGGGGGGYQASSAMAQGGGSYASARGMYEYESGSRSKSKHSETKTAVPICLPLCCAMPCVIM
ncbi:hypothetical protein HF086_006294 [Spodoptera exigua]|uniref:Uncharacterized protein n=1 Tax=Spodoptera exigua TaxID=7107 RepID=A0A922S944_SPOEX|nr:hypothetical protein HF086_006294 [Spodoptera exigua]